MKKIVFLIAVALLTFAFSNCSKSAVSAAECDPVVAKMIENLSKNLKPEEASKFEMLKAQMVPVIQKECQSGKYRLDCLAAAKDLDSLQTCKK